MRGARLLLAVLVALAAGACARQQTTYIIDPNTGLRVPVLSQQELDRQQGGFLYGHAANGQPQYAQPQPSGQQFAQQQYAQQPAAQSYDQNGSRGLFSSSPAYAQQSYAQPVYQPPQRAPAPSGRGLFNRRQTYAQPSYTQPSYAQPSYAQPQPQVYAAQTRYAPQYAQQGGPYAAAPYGYAPAPSNVQPAYTLDSGDKLRIVVFGQDGITNSYLVDAGGNVNLPLVGSVPARGFGTQQLSKMIAERLKQGYVREPHVSVEVEAYRPFFILGEVTNPGQYPYVANMTAETAIAIAGGFAPRASKGRVELTRNAPGQQMRGEVPLSYPLRPGDTVLVKERWF